MARKGAALYPPAAGPSTPEVRSIPTCKVCQHPDRAAIDVSLSQGLSIASQARLYGLPQASLQNHKAKHSPQPGSTPAARLKADADKLCESAERALADAETIKDPVSRVSAVTKATMALRSALDLAARIRGELSNSSGTMARTHLGMTLDEAKGKLDRLRDAETVTGAELAQQAADYLRAWNDTDPVRAVYVERPRKRRDRISAPVLSGDATTH